MAVQRKLGRSSDQRKALLRNQVTNLLWYGRIETTLARAKEVRSIAEKMVTLAIREHENTVSATKEYHNDKGQIVTIDVVNEPRGHPVDREGAGDEERLTRRHVGRDFFVVDVVDEAHSTPGDFGHFVFGCFGADANDAMT